ncbi:MAG: hypothetical protein AB8G18_13440 [Gammaproteobacteria bacterium]
MSTLAYHQAIWHQLLNDAPFAWFLRNEASISSSYTLQELGEEDDKLNSFFDAIRLGVESGHTVHDELDFKDTGAIFVSAVLGVMLDSKELFTLAIKEAAQDGERADELFYAVQWKQPNPDFLNLIEAHQSPSVRQAAIAMHELAPESAPVATWLEDSQDTVKCRVLDFIGQHRLAQYEDAVQSEYTNSAESMRFAAARAGLLINDSEARKILESLAVTSTHYSLEALELALRTGKSETNTGLVKKILSSDISSRVKVMAIAYSGLPEFMQVVLEAMSDIDVAQVAGEAFGLMTGVDIVEDDFDDEQPSGDEPTAAEKRAIDPFYRDYEEDLPWPHVVKCWDWWRDNGGSYGSGSRYLAGLEVNARNIERLLHTGNQVQRHAASVELGGLDNQRATFNTRLPVQLQKDLLR